MALAPTAAPPASAAIASAQGASAPGLQGFVFALFFIFGGITSLNDVIIPKLKDLFTLNYAQALSIQSAFFAAYFIMSLPGAAIVHRLGYMRTAAVGLLTMTAGCLLFIPASQSGTFAVFLVALFVLASGITIVQVVANPLISLLGPAATASSRLTFAQAFNSLGTTIFPYVGAIVILGGLASVDAKTLTGAALSAYRTAETQTVVHTYLALALALVIIAGVVWSQRNRLVESREAPVSVRRSFDLLQRPRFARGTLCIFLYVGAEVAIGSLIVSYLTRPEVMGLAQEAAGKHVPFYWAGALIGRAIGGFLLRRIAPGKLLAAFAAVVIVLLALSTHSTGLLAGWALLSIGLFNSIMFPTIFTLASEGLGTRAAEGSGLLCVAIVGGAVIPVITGKLADASSLQTAMIVPAICYAIIALYGLYARRPLARA